MDNSAIFISMVYFFALVAYNDWVRIVLKWAVFECGF